MDCVETPEFIMEEFDVLNYDEEYERFCTTMDQNLMSFQNNFNILDGTELNSEMVANLDKINQAVQSLLDSQNHKDKVLNNDVSDTIGKMTTEINDMLEKADDEETESRKVDTEAGKKRSELVNKKSQASTSQDMINHAKEKAAATMNKWKRILGLELVTSTHNTLIFTFTNIIRDNPDKSFSCEIRG